MINSIKSKFSKLTQKEFNSRIDRMGKVIHWEMCNGLKFDFTNKLYMNKPESSLTDETHKIIWDIEIQTVHSFLARRSN